jgi:hypothetical protein
MSATESSADTTLIAAVSGIGTVGAFAYLTVLLFENVPLGIVVGALSGTGTALLVSYFVSLEEDGPASDNVVRAFHSGAAGFGLSGAGIVTLAMLFVLERPLPSLAVGLAVGALEYAVVSRVLPRSGGA